MPVSGTWSCVLASDLTGSQFWSCPLVMGSVLFLVSCLAFWSCVLVQKLFLCSGLIPGPVSCFCSKVLIWSWSWVLAPSPAYWIPYTWILFPALPVKSHPLTLLLLPAAGLSYLGCLCSCALSSSSSTHPSTKMDVSPFPSFVCVDSWVLLLYHVCSPQLICVEKKNPSHLILYHLGIFTLKRKDQPLSLYFSSSVITFSESCLLSSVMTLLVQIRTWLVICRSGLQVSCVRM